MALFRMPRRSLLLEHLPSLPTLLVGEFFLAAEAGKGGRACVYRAMAIVHFSDLPPGIQQQKGLAKADKTSFWVLSEYWELANGKTGAGYGGAFFTFLSEDTKVVRH